VAESAPAAAVRRRRDPWIDRLRLDGEDRRIECLLGAHPLSAHAPTRDLHAFAERMTRGREPTPWTSPT
jgi:hypothetical protein